MAPWISILANSIIALNSKNVSIRHKSVEQIKEPKRQTQMKKLVLIRFDWFLKLFFRTCRNFHFFVVAFRLLYCDLYANYHITQSKENSFFCRKCAKKRFSISHDTSDEDGAQLSFRRKVFSFGWHWEEKTDTCYRKINGSGFKNFNLIWQQFCICFPASFIRKTLTSSNASLDYYYMRLPIKNNSKTRFLPSNSTKSPIKCEK